MQIEELLDRIHGVRRSGGGWVGLCPVPEHDDRNPSLSIKIGGDGRVLINCFRGCPYREILQALKMSSDDLTVEPPPKKDWLESPTFPSADSAAFYYQAKYGERGRWWSYHSPSGSEICRVGRFEAPQGKQIRPVSLQPDGRWHLKGPPAPRPLFNLPGVLQSSYVYVAEGEPCATALIKLGLCGTTGMNGANSARQTDWSPLSGKFVTLIPDNDQPGYAHMRAVTKMLAELPTPPLAVREVRTPGQDREDVVDFLKAHSEEELLLLLA